LLSGGVKGGGLERNAWLSDNGGGRIEQKGKRQEWLPKIVK